MFLHQPFGQLLPHALGHQCIGFAVIDHLPHQLQCFGCDLKTIAGGKAGGTQNAYRVFGKCGGNVAQDTVGQILAAAEGIDQAAVFVFCHGVDGKIAPQ